MSLTHLDVACRWADNAGRDVRESARGFAIWYRGATIYSYGSHFPIARFVIAPDGSRFILFTNCSYYSISTCKHISIVHHALRSRGYGDASILYVSDPSSRAWSELAKECVSRAAMFRASAKRRRVEHYRERDLRRAEEQEKAARLFRKWADRAS